jgi:hypothetical protein
LEQFEKTAVAPAVLGEWLCATSRQPDWKGMLASLLDALEPCGESLPAPARDAMRAAQGLLGCRNSLAVI